MPFDDLINDQNDPSILKLRGRRPGYLPDDANANPEEDSADPNSLGMQIAQMGRKPYSADDSSDSDSSNSAASLAQNQPADAERLQAAGAPMETAGQQKSQQSTIGQQIVDMTSQRNRPSVIPRELPVPAPFQIAPGRPISAAQGPANGAGKPAQNTTSDDWYGGQADTGVKIIHPGLYVDYPDKGKRKVGGDKSWRYNNPGNIHYSKRSPVSKNAIGHDADKFAIFATMQDGLDAQDQLWHTDRYQKQTLEDAIKTYTGGDSPEIQEAYIRHIVAATGADRKTKVSSLTPEQLKKLQAASRQQESGRKGRVIDIPKPAPAAKSKAQPR
jgi:hypothetical protein